MSNPNTKPPSEKAEEGTQFGSYHGTATAPSEDELAVFGGNVTFTEEEERALVRKLDWRIMPTVTILYLANFVDRTNIGNAKVAGLEKDIGLHGYQYNIGLSIFYIVYALSEVPSNLILKHVGANRWLPSIVVGFGLVCFSTAFVTNFGGFMVIRALLGLTEGGMMPGVAYYLSNYYRRHELVLRIGIFVSASSLSGAFGGLFASGLLKIPQIKGLPRGQWRNIFLVEGLLTVALGVGAYFVLPAEPQRDGRFLSERERLIATERLRGDTAGLVEKEKTEAGLVLRAWTSLNNWICAICFLLCNVTVQAISLFMPTLLSGFGYSKIESQLRTIPPYVVASIWSIFVAYCSHRTQKRGIWALITTPLSLVGAVMLVASANKKVGYAGIFFLAAGAFPLGPLFLSWATNNSAPYTVRAVSSAMVVSVGSMGPIVSSWIYLPKDGPRYIIGSAVQVGTLSGIIILTICLILYNTRENRLRSRGHRDYRLQRGNGKEENAKAVANLGHLHPKFKLTV